jgi:hypothetical protein
MLCAIFEYVSMGIIGKNIHYDIDFHAVLDSEVYYFVSSVNENLEKAFQPLQKQME